MVASQPASVPGVNGCDMGSPTKRRAALRSGDTAVDHRGGQQRDVAADRDDRAVHGAGHDDVAVHGDNGADQLVRRDENILVEFDLCAPVIGLRGAERRGTDRCRGDRRDTRKPHDTQQRQYQCKPSVPSHRRPLIVARGRTLPRSSRAGQADRVGAREHSAPYRLAKRSKQS